jgi:hypothetical protein
MRGTLMQLTTLDAPLNMTPPPLFLMPFLRRGWINLDLVWIAALLASGVALVAE